MKVIAIDLDNTALAYPNEVKRLFNNKENFIVIYTARPEHLRCMTTDDLACKEIPYHALVMDKIRADVYIDDKNAGGLNWEV